jgi:hypothetical protein
MNIKLTISIVAFGGINTGLSLILSYHMCIPKDSGKAKYEIGFISIFND